MTANATNRETDLHPIKICDTMLEYPKYLKAKIQLHTREYIMPLFRGILFTYNCGNFD